MKKLQKIGCITVIVIMLSPFMLLLGAMEFNVHVARDVERDLHRLTLPENTEAVDSLWYVGNLTPGGNDETVYCLGAILIRSDLSLEELKVYYDGLISYENWYAVDKMTGQMVPMLIDEKWVAERYTDMYEGLSFETEIDSDNYFAVYAVRKSLGDRLGIHIEGMF